MCFSIRFLLANRSGSNYYSCIFVAEVISHGAEVPSMSPVQNGQFDQTGQTGTEIFSLTRIFSNGLKLSNGLGL